MRCNVPFLFCFTRAGEVAHHHTDGVFFGNSEHILSALFTVDKPGGFQFFYVVRDRGKGDIKIFCDSTHGNVVFVIDCSLSSAAPYLLEHGEPVVVGKGLEGGDQLLSLVGRCDLRFSWHGIAPWHRNSGFDNLMTIEIVSLFSYVKWD